jgi:hypothetical protein
MVMPRTKDTPAKLQPGEVVMNRLDRTLRPHHVPSANDQLRAGDYADMLKEMLIPGRDLSATIKRLEEIADRSSAAKRILTAVLIQLRQDYQEFVR